MIKFEKEFQNAKLNNKNALLWISNEESGFLDLKAYSNEPHPFIFEKEPVEIEAEDDEAILEKTTCKYPDSRTSFDKGIIVSEIDLPVLGIELKYKNTKPAKKLSYYLTNFLFMDLPNYDVSIGGRQYRFELLGNHMTISNRLSAKNSLYTVKVSIDNVSSADIAAIDDNIHDICTLLSLASGNMVCAPRKDSFDEDNNVCNIRIYRGDNDLITNFPLVWIQHERWQLKSFLETCISNFVAHKQDILIANLINIILLTKKSQYIEQKLLMLSNFLEVIRHNYALNIAIPSRKYTQSNNDFYFINSSGTQKRASFEKIVTDFLSENSISGWKSQYKDMRNEVVHTGKISTSSVIPLQDSYHLLEFCERILLAMLKWDSVNGKYIPASCPSIPTKNIIGTNNIQFTR